MVTSSAGVAVSPCRLAIFAVAGDLLPFGGVNLCVSWCAKLQPVEINTTK